jgi:general secretion pathway protein J
MHPGARGFTLLELMLALAIVATLLALAFGGLRVGLAAWRQGEDRAEAYQHVRGLSVLLAQALAGTHAYRGAATEGEAPSILFRGEADRVSFVTVTPPFAADVPIAFTAVTFALERGEQHGMIIRQKVLPNLDPFEVLKPVFTDPTVSAVRFRYLRDKDGDWADQWDMAEERALPRAVEVVVATAQAGQVTELPPFTISIKATAP